MFPAPKQWESIVKFSLCFRVLCYNVGDIDASQIVLHEQVPAELQPSEIGDDDGVPDLMVLYLKTVSLTLAAFFCFFQNLLEPSTVL